jgi:hypothetical protein
MPTSTKKRKTKPKNQKNRGLSSAIAGLSSSLRPGNNRTRGGNHSQRGRKPSKRGRTRMAVGAGIGTRPRKPSRRGLIGVAAGAGLGGAVMAGRRRRGKQDHTESGPPAGQPAAAMDGDPTSTGPYYANDPTGGAQHGDPKGPDFADAA